MEACTYYIMHHEIVRLNRNGFILKLDEYIEKHLTEKITVPELCEEFLTSRTKLYETFSDTLNMSLGRYIKESSVRSFYLPKPTIHFLSLQQKQGSENTIISVRSLKKKLESLPISTGSTAVLKHYKIFASIYNNIIE